MKAARLLEYCLILLNRGIVQAKELADRFGVSERTVYRDIEALCEAGIPVASFPGRNGGYGLVEGFKMDRQLLKPDELSALEASLAGLSRSFGDADWALASEKIKSLSRALPHRLRRPADYLFIDYGETEAQRALLKTARAAIEESRLLSIRYKDAKGETSERVIEPHSIIFAQQAWYLHAWCRLRGEFRVFRLGRVRQAALLRERFLPRPCCEPSGLWGRGEGEMVVPMRLEFREPSIIAAEDYFGVEGLEESIGPDGTRSCVASGGFPVNEWLWRFLLGFGSGVRVLEPDSIRQGLAERARKILESNLT